MVIVLAVGLVVAALLTGIGMTCMGVACIIEVFCEGDRR